MASTLACIAGEEIHRQFGSGMIRGKKLGPQPTPFGPSGDVFQVEGRGGGFYLLSRHGAGMEKTAPWKVNYRANMFALKDLGIQHVLAWGPAGAITHTIAVGDLVILEDIIDQTYLRAGTFFENSPLGFLRQFPAFCPTLRRALETVLAEMQLSYHKAGTAVICEGPRLETPAEVRMWASLGAQVISHTFAPENFLAKELQLCYAAVCYVVNYAETGSRHRPFTAGDLFGGLMQDSGRERLAETLAAMRPIVESMTDAIDREPKICECDKTLAHSIEKYGLNEDWRQWIG